jgi:hypothetical protein
VNKAVDGEMAMTAAAAVFTKFNPKGNETGDLEKMYAELDTQLKGETPEVIKAARIELKERLGVRRDALNQRDAAVYRMLIDGKPLEQVRKTAAFRDLSMADQNKVLESSKKDKGDSYAHLQSFYALALDAPKLKQMSVDEVILYGQRKDLGAGATAQLVQRRVALDDPAKEQAVGVDTTDFNYAYVTGTGKQAKTTDEMYLRKLKQAEDRVYKEQVATGGVLPRARKQQIIKDVFTDVPIERQSWWDTKKALPDLTAEDVPKIVVPEDRRQGIIAILKSAKPNTEPTEHEIKAYFYYSTR